MKYNKMTLFSVLDFIKNNCVTYINIFIAIIFFLIIILMCHNRLLVGVY